MKVKKILAATDLSASADEAIRQAHERAGRNVRLIVCHVLPTYPNIAPFLLVSAKNFPYDLEQLRNQTAQAMKDRMLKITGRKPGQYEVLIGDGNPAAFIVSKAEQLGVGLVIVGSQGASGLTRLLLGSVADRVMRHAHCAVLIARPHTRSRKILVATDFSDPSLPAVAAAAEESRRTGAPVAILCSIELTWPLSVYAGMGMLPSSSDIPSKIMDNLKKDIHSKLGKALRSHRLSGKRIVEYGPAAAAILRSAEKIDPSLIIVGSVGRTGLSRLLLGSVSERVAGAAACSVLIVRLQSSVNSTDVT